MSKALMAPDSEASAFWDLIGAMGLIGVRAYRV